jgi:hypothetical protein
MLFCVAVSCAVLCCASAVVGDIVWTELALQLFVPFILLFFTKRNNNGKMSTLLEDRLFSHNQR